MKSFRFRPQGVLDLRRRRRDAAQGALGVVLHAMHEAESAVARIQAQCEHASVEYAASVQRSETHDGLERHRNWISRLRAEIVVKQRVVDDRRKAVDIAAGALRQAHQDVRVLERLKAHAQRRHDEWLRQEELKEMDQIASLRHARAMAEASRDDR